MELFRVSYNARPVDALFIGRVVTEELAASFHDDLADRTCLGRRGMAPRCVQT
jgi:hypothetical protein